MAGGGHALAQLHHAGALQNLTKLRLAYQKGLQQGILSILEVGQHSQLFHRLGLQVLRLVNDKQTALAQQGLGDEETLQRQQQIPL